jgi:hypothetical protein
MPFREKSAWGMGLLFLVITIWFIGTTHPLDWRSGAAPPPTGPLMAVTLFSIIGSIIIQSILAGTSPKEADAPADERERQLITRSSHLSGLVLGFGCISALFHYLVHRSGDTLFHIILLSLLVSTVVEYALQIFYFRRGH